MPPEHSTELTSEATPQEVNLSLIANLPCKPSQSIKDQLGIWWESQTTGSKMGTTLGFENVCIFFILRAILSYLMAPTFLFHSSTQIDRGFFPQFQLVPKILPNDHHFFQLFPSLFATLIESTSHI